MYEPITDPGVTPFIREGKQALPCGQKPLSEPFPPALREKRNGHCHGPLIRPFTRWDRIGVTVI